MYFLIVEERPFLSNRVNEVVQTSIILGWRITLIFLIIIGMSVCALVGLILDSDIVALLFMHVAISH